MSYPSNIIRDLPAAEYRARNGVSQSTLKRFGRAPSPAHFRAEEPTEPTPAMQLGTVLHSLVLEPKTAASAFVVRPDTYRDAKGATKPWHSGADACKQWLKDNAGKPIISGEELRAVQAMRDSVMSLPAARGLLHIGDAEVAFFSIDEATGLHIKGRVDCIATDATGETWLLDIKTTRAGCAKPEEFAKVAYDMGYHVQAAFYLDLTGASRFLFAAVESEPPYAASLIELDAAAIALGRDTYRRWLNAYAKCVSANVWPAYASGIQLTSLPKWAFKE